MAGTRASWVSSTIVGASPDVTLEARRFHDAASASAGLACGNEVFFPSNRAVKPSLWRSCRFSSDGARVSHAPLTEKAETVFAAIP